MFQNILYIIRTLSESGRRLTGISISWVKRINISLSFLFQYVALVPPGIGGVPPGELALPVRLPFEQEEVFHLDAAVALLAAPGKQT